MRPMFLPSFIRVEYCLQRTWGNPRTNSHLGGLFIIAEHRRVHPLRLWTGAIRSPPPSASGPPASAVTSPSRSTTTRSQALFLAIVYLTPQRQ